MNEIKIDTQQGVQSQNVNEGIHTIQLQSPGGRSHFVKGLVVTNSIPENSSTSSQTLSRMDQHGQEIMEDGVFLNDRSGGITLTDPLEGEDTTGQILQMVRLTTDENGETIIFVQPQDKINDSNVTTATPIVVLNSEQPIVGKEIILPPPITIPKLISAQGFSQNPITNTVYTKQENSPECRSKSKQVDTDDTSSEKSYDHEIVETRRCVVCLRRRKFTEDIFDGDRHPYSQITVLFAHLNLQIEGTPTDSGVCLLCLSYLQRWHIFHSTISERHDYARNTGSSIVDTPLNFHSLEAQFYKHYAKLLEVKEIRNAATHSHYTRRHLTDKDWDFFCERLTRLETDPEGFEDLKNFINCPEKLSNFFCTVCKKLIPRGLRGYSEHMTKEHNQSPVLYPCDICGKLFPEKTTPSGLFMDYFQHWLSHFHSKNNKISELLLATSSEKVESSSTPSWTMNRTSTTEDEETSAPEDEQIHSRQSKKRKRTPVMSTTRRERCQEKISQIKNLLQNSSFQHLIRRDLNENSLEFMAERLLSTKSNSSAKLKEIENMTFSAERMRNVFCDDCRKSVAGGKEGYHKHRKLEHKDTDEDLTIPCDICGNFYPEKDMSGLSQNYFAHWINHFYFEECDECQEKCPNENLLKKHKRLHEKRPGYPCPQCDKVLSKKLTLEQHIKTHLPAEEKMKTALKCEICGKTITAPTLKAHMFSVHSDERPWKCEVCGARFKHKSDLNGHRNAVHLKIKNYTCNICGKSFGHHCGLRVHIMSHENKRNHSCTTCGKRFLTLWHLKKHIDTHKEVKDIICPTCGKGFKKEEALQEHMTLHTGEMPYECHICGRKVRVLSNLYKHFMVHKKNKTYYSKKDGLPDPLDSYIVEQQKKKSVNKIVLEAEEARGHQRSVIKTERVILGDSPSPSEDISPTFEDDDDDILGLEAELQVNRSTNRVVTYRGSAIAKTKSENPPQSMKASLNSVPDEKPSILSSGREEYVIEGAGDSTGWPKLGPVIISDEVSQMTTRSSSRPS